MQSKKPLINSILLAAALATGGAEAEWEYNTEVFFAASDDASVSGVRWLQPWWQTGRAMAFSDTRILKSDKATEELNLGGGYRRFNDDESAIYGGYGFLDYRLSATNKAFTQLTFGGEYLMDAWEFRSNLYLPIKDQYVIGDIKYDAKVNDSFIGNTVTRVTTSTPDGLEVEEALQGFDIEAGYLLPRSEDFEIRANLAIYQYSAPVAGSTQGLRARVEAFPRENFKVSFTIESDDLFKTRSFLELSLPLGHKIGRPGKRSLHKRMTQFAYRDIDVRETSRLDISKRTKNGRGTAESIANTTTSTVAVETGIAHIDSSKIVANPDGSIERPYNNIAECEAATSATYHCAGTAETIYLHAAPSTLNNGIAQHYIGNLTLNGEQKLVGDGATTGFFANLSTKTSPILLGADTSTSPLVTMNDTSSLLGVQLGWTFEETVAGSSTPTPTILPAGSSIPDTAVLVNNTGGARIRDVTITGSSSAFNTSNNFATGVHFQTDGSLEKTGLTINKINIQAVLGDAIHAETNLTTSSKSEQALVIFDSTIGRSGRGIHASVTGNNGSNAKQTVEILSDNPSLSTLVNQIQQNYNEGILIENLTANNFSVAQGNYAAALTNYPGLLATYQTALAAYNLNPIGPPPIEPAAPQAPFTATQDLTVQNALIQSNQGAGIQTLLGPTEFDADGQFRTSTVDLDNVNLNLNDGSGLVLESRSTKVDAKIHNSLISANLLSIRAFGNSNGERLDGVPIDCDNDGTTAVGDCNTQGSNSERTSNAFRREGYGIYAKNTDTASSAGTQSIFISENFSNTLHSKAQIFLDSQGLLNNSSTQFITLTPVAEEPRKIKDPSAIISREFFDTRMGQTTIVNGNIIIGQVAGGVTPKIAFCDDTAGSTSPGGLAPHIQAYGGELASISRQEVCP